MAGPITWRNVQAADFSEASNILDRATKTIGRGIDRVSKGVEGINQTRIDNRKDEVDQATQDAIQAFKTENQDVDALRARQQAGDFTKDKLKGQYGDNVNLDRLIAGIESHDEELRSDFVKDAEYENAVFTQDELRTNRAQRPYVAEVSDLYQNKEFDKAEQTLATRIASGEITKEKGAELRGKIESARQNNFITQHNNQKVNREKDAWRQEDLVNEIINSNATIVESTISNNNSAIQTAMEAAGLSEFLTSSGANGDGPLVFSPKSIEGVKVDRRDPSQGQDQVQEIKQANIEAEKLFNEVMADLVKKGEVKKLPELDQIRDRSLLMIQKEGLSFENGKRVLENLENLAESETDFVNPAVRNSYSSKVAEHEQIRQEAYEAADLDYKYHKDRVDYALPDNEEVRAAGFAEVTQYANDIGYEWLGNDRGKTMTLLKEAMINGYPVTTKNESGETVTETYFPPANLIKGLLDASDTGTGILNDDGIDFKKFKKAMESAVNAGEMYTSNEARRLGAKAAEASKNKAYKLADKAYNDAVKASYNEARIQDKSMNMFTDPQPTWNNYLSKYL